MSPTAQAGRDCPASAKDAAQLILVLSPAMNSMSASVRYFERNSAGRWHGNGESGPAVLGRNGMAWSWAFQQFAAKGEPVKKEGDGRTPAGFFTLGRAFGFSSAKSAHYTRLKKGEHFCVDDPRSPLYNSIVARADAGAVSGEDMATIPLYREGIFVDYPTSREAKGGSCIFIHVWRSRKSGTAGCVALAEPDVKDMQRRSAEQRTVLAILPTNAWERLRGCFPGL